MVARTKRVKQRKALLAVLWTLSAAFLYGILFGDHGMREFASLRSRLDARSAEDDPRIGARGVKCQLNRAATVEARPETRDLLRDRTLCVHATPAPVGLRTGRRFGDAGLADSGSPAHVSNTLVPAAVSRSPALRTSRRPTRYSRVLCDGGTLASTT